MSKNLIEQIKRIAKNEGYEEIILNINKKVPIIIEGIKGCFVPEGLCYIKGRLKAIITFMKSLDDVEEFYKITLFMDYVNKNNLYLYITYDRQKFSHEEILQKFMEKGVEMYRNTNIVVISL